MTNDRHDIYKEVHKGIRKELFDLVSLAGNTEFQSAQSLEKLKMHFDRTYNLLEIHAHSEDSFVEPFLLDCSTNLAKDLSDTHNKLESYLKKLQVKLSNLQSNHADVITYGTDLYLELTRFVSAYLQHMADEEQLVMPMLWKTYDDETLVQLTNNIRSNVPPGAMRKFLSCMIPAMNHSERVLMFSGLKMSAPVEVFERTCELGKSVMSSDDWDMLTKVINC